MGILDMNRPTIANPFVAESIATSWFADLKNTAGSTSAIDRKILLLSDSTGNQSNEWFGIGMTAFCASIPDVRVLYYTWSDSTTSWVTNPVILQAGTPVGSPTIVNGQVANDTFTRTASELSGTYPDVGGIWVTSSSFYSVDGSKAVANGSGLVNARFDSQARGTMTFTGTVGVRNDEASKQYRLGLWYADDSNYIRMNMIGSTSKSITLIATLAGTTRTMVTFPAGVIPASTGLTAYSFSITADASTGDVSATLNGTTVTATLTSPELAALKDNTFVMWGSNGTGAYVDNFTVSVNGISTYGPYRTLKVYNAAVAGTTLDYQTSDANAARRTAILAVAPEVLVVAEGHNYDADSITTFQSKIEAGIALAQANQPSIAHVILSSQNPEYVGSIPDAARAALHNARQLAVRQWALGKGWGYIPGYEPFASRYDAGQSLVSTDGVHPLTSGTLVDNNGSMLWGDTFHQYLASKLAAAT